MLCIPRSTDKSCKSTAWKNWGMVANTAAACPPAAISTTMQVGRLPSPQLAHLWLWDDIGPQAVITNCARHGQHTHHSMTIPIQHLPSSLLNTLLQDRTAGSKLFSKTQDHTTAEHPDSCHIICDSRVASTSRQQAPYAAATNRVAPQLPV